MRGKQASSESDGLFTKANRKHQILLNFELKRIAVEQKMRERYFAFEKSLMIAHREKIISRQKSLGIYRPQTTPDKKRPKDSFFITAVAMETKARMKLPPVVDRKRDTHNIATRGKKKEAKIKAERNPPNSYNILIHQRPKVNEPLPVLKHNFAVVQDRKGSSSSRTSTKDVTVSSSLRHSDDLKPFVRHDEPEEAGLQTGEKEGEKIHDRGGENGIENKQTVKNLKHSADSENEVENVGNNFDPQKGINAEKTEDKQRDVVNKEKEERKEESESDLLKNSAPNVTEAPEKEDEAGENILEKKEENYSSGSVKTFKQRDGDNTRSKSVLSGVMDDNTRKVSVFLRAQSAGVQGRGTKIAP